MLIRFKYLPAHYSKDGGLLLGLYSDLKSSPVYSKDNKRNGIVLFEDMPFKNYLSWVSFITGTEELQTFYSLTHAIVKNARGEEELHLIYVHFLTEQEYENVEKYLNFVTYPVFREEVYLEDGVFTVTPLNEITNYFAKLPYGDLEFLKSIGDFTAKQGAMFLCELAQQPIVTPNNFARKYKDFLGFRGKQEGVSNRPANLYYYQPKEN